MSSKNTTTIKKFKKISVSPSPKKGLRLFPQKLATWGSNIRMLLAALRQSLGLNSQSMDKYFRQKLWEATPSIPFKWFICVGKNKITIKHNAFHRWAQLTQKLALLTANPITKKISFANARDGQDQQLWWSWRSRSPKLVILKIKIRSPKRGDLDNQNRDLEIKITSKITDFAAY